MDFSQHWNQPLPTKYEVSSNVLCKDMVIQTVETSCLDIFGTPSFWARALLSQEPQAKMLAAGDHLKQLMESLGPSGTGASWRHDKGREHSLKEQTTNYWWPLAVVLWMFLLKIMFLIFNLLDPWSTIHTMDHTFHAIYDKTHWKTIRHVALWTHMQFVFSSTVTAWATLRHLLTRHSGPVARPGWCWGLWSAGRRIRSHHSRRSRRSPRSHHSLHQTSAYVHYEYVLQYNLPWMIKKCQDQCEGSAKFCPCLQYFIISLL